jgi:serine/threonine protein kinase
MTTAIAIEDVRREVKILRALSGHQNLVRFYDSCEDNLNVYIVMEYVLLHTEQNFLHHHLNVMRILIIWQLDS